MKLLLMIAAFALLSACATTPPLATADAENNAGTEWEPSVQSDNPGPHCYRGDGPQFDENGERLNNAVRVPCRSEDER